MVRVVFGEKSILDESTAMRAGDRRNLLGIARYQILRWTLTGNESGGSMVRGSLSLG